MTHPFLCKLKEEIRERFYIGGNIASLMGDAQRRPYAVEGIEHVDEQVDEHVGEFVSRSDSLFSDRRR